MELTIFSCCSYSVSYQQASVGGWKLISGATGDETVKRRQIGHAHSVWNNVVLWWKYCLWALEAYKAVALGSSAKFELDCQILKLHPKGGDWELFSMAKLSCSHCLRAGIRLKHVLPHLLCALLSVGRKPGCRRKLHYALVWNRIWTKGDQDLRVHPKVPFLCWTKYFWAELAIPFLITKNY